jgi:F0F1-type ATP synthase delta subunit
MFIDSVDQSVMRHDNPVKYPGISEQLRAIAVENQVDLKDIKKCEELLKKLDTLKDKAPSVHVSFPTEPTPEILQKLVNWFRAEIDKNIVIQVGMQPTIAAGVILRTPNKQFDFSLRKHLYQNRKKLAEAIDSVQ